MSQWHREHPELTGSAADPWMDNPGHAKAARDVTAIQGCRASMEAVEELEAAGDTGCTICGRPSFSHHSEAA